MLIPVISWEKAMRYYVSIFLKGIRDKKFFLALLIILLSMIFSLSAWIEEGMDYFFHHDYIMTFLQGYNGDRTLLVGLAPLIATMPFAAQHIENRRSGAMKYIVSRMGYKKYFDSIFITNALLSFAVFIFGMLSFLLVSILFFDKNININIYYGITRISVYEAIARKSPLLYIGVIILHCSFVAVAYSSVGLAMSYFIKNKFVAWVSPFIVATIASLFAMFIGFTKLEPMAIFDVSRVKGVSIIFVIIYLILTVGCSYVVSYKKFKRDIEADEEV